MLIYSLDPSLTRIGWASFASATPGGTWEDADTISSPKWDFGTFIPGALVGEGEATKVQKITSVRDFFIKKDLEVDELVYEMPSFFSSVEGRVAAKQGYTIDLGLVIGIAIGRFTRAKLFPYSVQSWKGSVSKDITKRKYHRIFRDGHSFDPPHDAIDAIMLLRHHLETVHQVRQQKVG